MKRFKTLIAVILTFTMILTGGASLSLLAVSAETGSDGADKKAAQSKDVSDPSSADADKEDGEDAQSSADNSNKESGSAESSSDAGKGNAASEEREIKVKLVKDPLYQDDEKKVKTDVYRNVSWFWTELTGRKASVTSDDLGMTVTVKGKLPEGVTAQADYIKDDDAVILTEQGMCSFELQLFDEEGDEYVPDDPVTVSIKGKAVKKEIKDENGLIVYSYEDAYARAEEYAEAFQKESVYAEDVKVFKSENVKKKYLNYKAYKKDKEYKDGEDAVRYFNDKKGLKAEDDTVSFEYDFNKSFGEGSERYKAGEDEKDVAAKSARFVLSAQMKERTLKTNVGDAHITVKGAFDKDVELTAEEITEKNKSYEGYVEGTAKELDKDASEIYMARVFDIKLIDPKTGKEFEPDSKTSVSIDLGDEKIDDGETLDVVHFTGKKNKKAEVMDTSADGSAVKFETDGYSVYVVAQVEKETVLTAKDGKKYKITVTYGRAAGIPEDAELSARELNEEEYEEYYKKAAGAINSKSLGYARFFDISITGKDGKEYQPDDDVSVKIELMDKEDKTDLKVVHFGDRPEVLLSETKGDEVSFDTDSFSVFAVVNDGELYDEDGNRVFLRTYRFFNLKSDGDYEEYQVPTDQGTMASTQRIKNGEKPVAPVISDDPTDSGAVFDGWYEDIGEGGDVQLADKPYDFNDIPEITKDEEIHLYAKYKKTISVVFHEQYDSDKESFPVAATRKVELTTSGGHDQPTGTIDVSEIETKYYDKNNNAMPGMEFCGWYATPVSEPGSKYDDEGNEVGDPIEGSVDVTEDENNEFYPLFRPVKWLSFYSAAAGLGATYFSPKSIAEGQEYQSLSDFVPDMSKKKFTGWYTGSLTITTDGDKQIETVNYNTKITSEDGSLIAGARDDEHGVKVEGGKLILTDNATLYAKWEDDPDGEDPSEEPQYYHLVKIDPNGGALYTYDAAEENLSGTGSTWFWSKDYGQGGEPIEEYSNVTRDYVESDFGDHYYVNQNRDYYDLTDEYEDREDDIEERKTYYTSKISEATSLNTYRYSPGAYRYAGWYEVNSDGSETPYEFGHPVTHDTTLKLHWKKAGEYYIVYDPVMDRDGKKIEGMMDDGSESAEDPNGYADNASIELTRNARAPEGYDFVGWSVRGDDSGKVYRTDEVINLSAEHAVTVNGKDKIFFEAVYSKASSAKIEFDANGGSLIESLPEDFEYVENPYAEEIVFSVGIDKKSVTATRLINNGVYKMTETPFFEREGLTFTGWNTKADGSGKHYDAGAECGIDSNEPITLYAEWKVKVWFDKNESQADWDETSWGTEKTDGSGNTYYEGKNDKLKYYQEDGKYYALVNVDAALKEPDIRPAHGEKSFDFWSTSSSSSAEPFEFGKTKITGETQLYAHWTTSALIPIHVFTYDPGNSDADATDQDSWRKTSKAELAPEETKTTAQICSTYLSIPDEYASKYDYAYAYIGTQTDKTKPDEGNPVKSLAADASGKVTVSFQSGDPAELEEGQALYLVYAPKVTSAQVKLRYVKESDGGMLQDVVGAEDGYITYGASSDIRMNDSFVPRQLNDAVVSQNQIITVTGKELVISQGSTKNFNMPSRLDDGSKEMGLIYSRIGTGNEGANSLSSIDSDHDKKLRLQIREGQLQWSYDGEKWNDFTGDGEYTPTVYAVYREKGHELKITKTVTKEMKVDDDTDIRDFKEFTITITSDAITEDSYSVEGTGYNTVEATPAKDGEPGSIELPIKHNGEVIINGLAEGDYVIKETDNENYTLTAKSGKENSTLTDNTVTGNTTLEPITLDDDMEAALSNEPKDICRIDSDGAGNYVYFNTLNSAFEYAKDSDVLGGNATIEMLVDYVMPAKDSLIIPNTGLYDIEITTATGGAYEGSGSRAVLSREKGFTKAPMFENGGALTFSNIVLDGKNAEVSSSMVSSSAEEAQDSGDTGDEIKSGLYISDNASFINANNTGNGGAISISKGKAYISGGSFENNKAAKGGAIYVSSGDLEISGGAIGASGKGNHADEGGAIYYAGGGTVTLKGGSISYNAADKGNGGGIYAANGTIEIKGGQISNNTAAEGNGGGVFAESAVVNVSGGQTKVNNNTAKSGGAVYFDQSGTFEMTGGEIMNNTATAGDGGAVMLPDGSAKFSGGTMSGNTAANGKGGAFYSGNVRDIEVKGGTYSNNTAINGSAIFINDGSCEFTSCNITGNTSTQGGAVGVGSSSASLAFSGTPKIQNNYYGSSSSGRFANVYLDQDTDTVISNPAAFGNGAYVGIYVPGSFEGDLFENRGEPGSIFGSFAASYDDKATIAAFKNDRLGENVSAIAISNTKAVMWGKPIQVEVRYMQNFGSGFPPNGSSTVKYTNNTYYLPASENSVSSVAEDLRNNYNINLPTNTAMFAGAFLQGDDNYNKYLTDVDWDNGEEGQSSSLGWKGVRRYKDAGGDYHRDDCTKLVIYYSEAAYISIENNTDYELDITALNVFDHNAINGDDLNDAGYGFVYADNGAIRDELLPITADDLKLEPMKSVKLVFPGACGKNYVMTGEYKNVPGGTDIPVRINGTAFGNVPSDKLSSFTLGTSAGADIPNTPALPSKSGDSVDIVFGGDKPICKIETQEVTLLPADNVTVKTNPDASGKVQYCFSTLNDAKNFAVNHSLTTTSIQMLVDYLIPASDVLAIPAGYDITLTTATGSGEGYYYDGDRATISRDPTNMESFITSAGGNNTTLRVENLKFDGKSLGGNINGGVVKTSQCVVIIDNAEFVNCIANNGGGIYVEKGNRNDVNLSVSNTKFENCRSKSTANRQGGGAIWTDVRKNTTVSDVDKSGLYLYKCSFNKCSAYDQGGAVFHRIDSNVDSVTTLIECRVIGCEARAAGGMESDAKNVKMVDCLFKDCTATDRNGGGANFYTLNNANPTTASSVTATGCTFENCRSTNLGSGDRYGGGFRSTATHTYLTDCTFTNCSAKRGGGIGISNKNAVLAEVHGCVIDGCTSSEYGGGIFCTAKTFNIDNVIAEGKTRRTEIKNCTAGTTGGGIRYERDAAGTEFNVSNATISNNTSNGAGNNGNGGGLSIKGIRTVTIKDSLIQKNVAKSNGGGINIGGNANDRRLTLDNTDVIGNRSGGQGGGIYSESHITLMNGSNVKNNVISTAAQNAAGIYLIDNRTLTVGDASVTGKDSSSVIGNETDGKVPSNVRLWSANGINATASVYVACDLSGRIGVVNASAKGTQFGSSRIADPKGFGYADGTQVFRADDETLFGVVDRADPNGKKIIWRGDVICKITDEAGHLLYLGEDDPAVFDALDVGNENDVSKKSAFSYLRNARPALYYKDGTPYTGNNYCVKMLESYKITNKIIAYKKNTSNRTITLTTAGRTDADYPYRGKPGVPATITRHSNYTEKDMITAGWTFNLKNITIDGAKTQTSNTRIIRTYPADSCARITIGNKATLQNARVSGDGEEGWGGAVFSSWPDNAIILDGGEIKNCNATSGGGIYKDGSSSLTIISGSITGCSATSNGGGVYFAYTNKNAARNILVMEGGSITKCSASQGGGLFLADKCTLRMSGGNIKNNTATSAGGGIAVGGSNARLHFSGRVTISGNKLNGEACNVELGYGSTKIINTSGLDRRAYIGVYVPGGSLYESYGVVGRPFGSYTSSANLQRFINDRNGCKGGVKPEDPGTAYWVEGTRKVILRKVSNSYNSLEGAKFTVYHSDLDTVVSDTDNNRLENLESNGNGVFYTGEMYYGTYYVKETVAPEGYTKPARNYYFIITVSSNGVGYHSADGYDKEITARPAD